MGILYILMTENNKNHPTQEVLNERVHSKKTGLIEELEVSKDIKRKLLMCLKYDDDMKNIRDNQFNQEYNALKTQFEPRYHEYHKMIEKIVMGEECPEISEEDMQMYDIEQKEIDKEIADGKNQGAIPQYWMKALKNAKFLPINKKDEEIHNH